MSLLSISFTSIFLALLSVVRPVGAFRSKGTFMEYSGGFVTEERHSVLKTGRAVTPTALQARLRYQNMDEMLESLEDEPSIVVVLFTSENCGPCRLQKKELRRLWLKSKKHQEEHELQELVPTAEISSTPLPLKILTIDMEKWPTVGRRFKVGKLPSLLVFQGSQDNAHKLEGLVSAEELWKHMESFDASEQMSRSS
jgi:thiol-disulfide isomerase/thioredoxin